MRMLRCLLSSLLALAVLLGAFVLAPSAKAIDASVEQAFEDLSNHYELSGNLSDYPFVYWIDGNGKTCLKVFPADTNSISIVRQNGDSDSYFYALPSPLPNEPTVYTIFYINNRAYYSNDWSAVNMDFSGLSDFELYGSFPDSSVNFPAPITGGKAFSYSQVSLGNQITSLSNAGLLSELYDVSFVVQGVSDDKHSSLISRSLAVTPLALRDDSGYNMIFLEVPQLETDIYQNDVIWGYYLFKPHYTVDKYYFNGLKLSFAYDPIDDTEDLASFPASSFFEVSVNSQPLTSGGSLTVNSASWLYGGKVKTIVNREFTIYDYSSDSNNLYPTFMFHSIASSNRYSAGSFCYNFDTSGMMSVDSEGNSAPTSDAEKDDLADSGNDDNANTKAELGFLPYSVTYGSLNDSFSWDNSQEYDFSSVADLLGSIFSNSFIITILTACCVVGLIGYVLYGKN